MHQKPLRFARIGFWSLLAALGAGCGRPMLSTSGVTLRSVDEPVMYAPSVVTSGYRAADASSADLYVSDIPLARLASADSLEGLNGTILHMHMFLRPRPGKTPVETTASTVTIRQVVITDGEVGLYGGGGFLFPSGEPGDRTFGGSVRRGSVRLLASTPGFADRLGAAEISVGLVAPQDEAAASVLAHLLDHASRVARGGRTASGG